VKLSGVKNCQGGNGREKRSWGTRGARRGNRKKKATESRISQKKRTCWKKPSGGKREEREKRLHRLHMRNKTRKGGKERSKLMATPSIWTEIIEKELWDKKARPKPALRPEGVLLITRKERMEGTGKKSQSD